MTESKLLFYVAYLYINVTFNKQTNKGIPLRAVYQSSCVIVFLIIPKNIVTFTDTIFFIIHWHYGGSLSLVSLIYS